MKNSMKNAKMILPIISIFILPFLFNHKNEVKVKAQNDYSWLKDTKVNIISPLVQNPAPAPVQIANQPLTPVLVVDAEKTPSANVKETGGKWQVAIKNDCKNDGTDNNACKAQIEAIKKASVKYNINPAALTAICLSENCSQNHAHNPNGENSHGSFQYNIFGERWNQTHLGLKWIDCAKDFDCSADLTAYRIINQYGKNTDWSVSNPSGWITKLSKHNGNNPFSWYLVKIEKNGLAAGLTF